jgi:CMP-N,N'-diacetyllegionaminic acid synthase
LINGKKVLAIIPARGGSKRLPKKNVLPLAGKPLIGWTIEAAQQSNYIDDIFVSTDCDEIASVVSRFGVTVPELRPEELASDASSTQDVVLYTLEKFGKESDIVLILQPTSPFRDARHIDESIEMLVRKSALSIVSVTTCEHPPNWANTLPLDLSMERFLNKGDNVRSQDIEVAYRLNGAIYVYDVRKLLMRMTLSYTNETYAYIMKNEHSVDIDTELDFKFADFLLRNKYK